MNNRNRIAVVGSLSVDQYVRVEKFPQAGETVLTDGLEISFGGKGANQAVAASRLGAEVEMIGCVGADEMGHDYIGRLRELGIGTTGIQMVEGAPTGRAFIMLDPSSENVIVSVVGANSQLREGMVVTRGADATLARIGGEMIEVPPGAIVPVDTVGAGDTFCGALAVSMGVVGLGVSERLEFANRAAGLSTPRVGAQGAMPTLRDLR